MDAKPSGSKGNYINSMSVCTTMGPGIPLEVNAAVALVK